MEAEKKCPKCKQNKSNSEFNKCRKSKDGLQCHCKSCQKMYHIKHRKTTRGKAIIKRYAQSEKRKVARKRYNLSDKGIATNKIYAQSEKGKTVRQAILKRFNACHPNQAKARHAVNDAITAGRLPKPDTLLCFYCPKPAEQYHHHQGYAKEHCLDVIPVCVSCHSKCKKKIA